MTYLPIISMCLAIALSIAAVWGYHQPAGTPENEYSTPAAWVALVILLTIIIL